jgi:NAD+ synthase
MRELNYNKLIADIQKWIESYVKSANAKGVVLGMSGGIDSTLVAALSKNAIGKENVLGLLLPIESIAEDIEDARLVSKFLQIPYRELDLTPVYKKMVELFSSDIKSNAMAIANIKPRLRMTTVYTVAQSKNYLVIGTGNRSEIAIGYFTKFGDGGVDFNPIASLYKQEVRELARILKLPKKIISKKPSAGLWPGQTDEGEIGMQYDLLDEILYRIDYNLDFQGINKNDIEKVKKMMIRAEHKLKMFPSFKIN